MHQTSHRARWRRDASRGYRRPRRQSSGRFAGLESRALPDRPALCSSPRGVRDAAVMAAIDPGIAPEVLHLELEELVIEVGGRDALSGRTSARTACGLSRFPILRRIYFRCQVSPHAASVPRVRIIRLPIMQCSKTIVLAREYAYALALVNACLFLRAGFSRAPRRPVLRRYICRAACRRAPLG